MELNIKYMEEKSKVTTSVYYVCGDCSKKMEGISLGSGGSDIFSSMFSKSPSALYCNNKECPKFGFLTVAGVKKEE